MRPVAIPTPTHPHPRGGGGGELTMHTPPPTGDECKAGWGTLGMMVRNAHTHLSRGPGSRRLRQSTAPAVLFTQHVTSPACDLGKVLQQNGSGEWRA